MSPKKESRPKAAGYAFTGVKKAPDWENYGRLLCSFPAHAVDSQGLHGGSAVGEERHTRAPEIGVDQPCDSHLTAIAVYIVADPVEEDAEGDAVAVHGDHLRLVDA